MICSTRLLILLSVLIAVVSAMGWFGGGGSPRRGCEGDWPEEFPQEPEGFKFRCKCPCKCKPKSSSTTTSSTPLPTTTTSTTVVTTPTSTASSTPPTTTTSTTVTTPTTTPTTVSTSTSPSTSTSVPSTTVETETTETVIEDTGKGAFLIGQEVLVHDEPGSEIISGATGTTFWIRSPTPPNTPAPVVRGGHAFTVGSPQDHTVKILAPSAPDRALDPFAMPSGDLDFNFKTVGTPKPPRAVVHPDE